MYVYDRFGTVYKSHILGCQTIVCMDPEIKDISL